ncbi:conserved hypothetical protein [metagenome]|uniref:DUF3099 domain-containing protein n=1 Tax=metagenome TaxID=256318 RepID=A0A2P2C6U0_9ZZZZ
MAARRQRDPSTAVRITTAGASRADDIAGRQRRYLLSMGVRTLCVVGAVLVGPTWYRWVLIAGGVFIPYVAVVLANVVNVRDDGFSLLDAAPPHKELSGGPQHLDSA